MDTVDTKTVYSHVIAISMQILLTARPYSGVVKIVIKEGTGLIAGQNLIGLGNHAKCLRSISRSAFVRVFRQRDLTVGLCRKVTVVWCGEEIRNGRCNFGWRCTFLIVFISDERSTPRTS